MDNIVNRSLCLAQWKNGDITVMFSRFTHKGEKLTASYVNHHKGVTISSIKRIDRILQVYRGSGVHASVNDERSMINQSWNDVYMMDEITLDRDRFNTVGEMFSWCADFETEEG